MSTRTRLAAVVGIIGVLAITAACAPPAPPEATTWSFKATSVTVNDHQDGENTFLGCIDGESLLPPRFESGCRDEPYVLNIGFRVKLGVANSAQTFVVNPRSSAPQDVSQGSMVNLTGAQQATATFSNVTPLDVFDLSDPNNKLEVVGIYTWAMERDVLSGISNGYQDAANSVANTLKSTLNNTLAQNESLPADNNLLFNLIFSNIGSALVLGLANLDFLGLGDDIMGGALYLGIGAKGTLASILEGSIGSSQFNFSIPGSVPPDINGGGFFTFGSAKTFTKTFTANGGQHTYGFSVGPA